MSENCDSAILESLKRIPLDQIPLALEFLSARLLNEMRRERSREIHAATPDREELLTAKQLATRLNVPESWIRTEQRAGRIPAIRLGKYVRFRRTEVEAALARGPR